jgi:hypothetical protein
MYRKEATVKMRQKKGKKKRAVTHASETPEAVCTPPFISNPP